MIDRIDAFARRLRSDAYFLASALEDYAASERLDASGLADAVGCGVGELGPLGLCRRPRSDREHFMNDVQEIARRFNLPEERLAEVVRRSDALAALRDAESEDVIAAARDRGAPDAPPYDDPL